MSKPELENLARIGKLTDRPASVQGSPAGIEAFIQDLTGENVITQKTLSK